MKQGAEMTVASANTSHVLALRYLRCEAHYSRLVCVAWEWPRALSIQL